MPLRRVRRLWREMTRGMDVHVVPIDDVAEHENSMNCWCGPVRDDEVPAVVVHNSGDGRELYESGERRVN